jgi:adenylate cyclase
MSATVKLEIERKFLVNELPFSTLAKAIKVEIQQGYLTLESNRELRIRRMAEKFYLTEKKGSGLCREESEIFINEEVFYFLWPMTDGMQLEKSRFTFILDGYRMELDVYKGSLKPLMILEVEFESKAESAAFTPPNFAVSDVTEDKRYKNACLAKVGRPNHE